MTLSSKSGLVKNNLHMGWKKKRTRSAVWPVWPIQVLAAIRCRLKSIRLKGRDIWSWPANLVKWWRKVPLSLWIMLRHMRMKCILIRAFSIPMIFTFTSRKERCRKMVLRQVSPWRPPLFQHLPIPRHMPILPWREKWPCEEMCCRSEVCVKNH